MRGGHDVQKVLPGRISSERKSVRCHARAAALDTKVSRPTSVLLLPWRCVVLDGPAERTRIEANGVADIRHLDQRKTDLPRRPCVVGANPVYRPGCSRAQAVVSKRDHRGQEQHESKRIERTGQL